MARKYLDTTGLTHLVDKLDDRYHEKISITKPLSALCVQVTDIFPTDMNLKAALGTLKSGKQDTLVSGTNIKTINGNSILGSGNIVISGGGITRTVLRDIEPMASVQSYDSYTVTSDFGLNVLKQYKLILVSITIGPGVEGTTTFDPNCLDGEGVMIGYDGCTWRFRPYANNIVIFNANSSTSSLYTLKIIGFN